MKKILFITSILDSGGISKSLISLLSTMDRSKYSIDLMLLNPNGVFMDLLPENINIIYDHKTSLSFTHFPKCILLLLSRGYVITAILRFLAAIVSRFDRGYSAWILSKIFPNNNLKYDVAVDYNGQHLMYYMVDKLDANLKLTFFHFDYSKWNEYYSIDKKYYTKVDRIFCVSDSCMLSMKKYFPDCDGKISVMENIVSSELICKLSEDDIYDMDYSMPAILTVGHVCKQKGVDLAIEAASILTKKNVRYKWYFVGLCSEMEKYSKMVVKYNVSENIVFLGLKVNPYPYIKHATVFCLPSQFEGKSIALDEAKILCKPIVVTNFSTVYDQFEDNVNATICDMNPESLSMAVFDLLMNEDIQCKYKTNLANSIVDNRNEINKLYDIIIN